MYYSFVDLNTWIMVGWLPDKGLRPFWDAVHLWRLEDLYGRSVTAPAFADGRIVLGDAEGYVHFIDASSGRLVGRTHIDGSGISVRPLTDGKRVYALANDGSLEALDIRP